MNSPARIRRSISSCSSSLDRLLGLLDQGQHVAHAEDPGGHPVGVEDLELVELLPDRGELDRLAGDRLHRERGAAARVAVELRQDDAVEGDPLLERLGDVDGLLTRHRVEDEQDVERLDGVADADELVHQLLVDVQPAGRVDDHGRRGRRPSARSTPLEAASTAFCVSVR